MAATATKTKLKMVILNEDNVNNGSNPVDTTTINTPSVPSTGIVTKKRKFEEGSASIGGAMMEIQQSELCIRLGQVENARRHLKLLGVPADADEWKKLDVVEQHIIKCTNARKVADWKCALRETKFAIVQGANSSHQLMACKAESRLKLNRVCAAAETLSKMPEYLSDTTLEDETSLFEMHPAAYPSFVRAQVELSLGRFEHAKSAIEKAAEFDIENLEVSLLVNIVGVVVEAYERGNSLFTSSSFSTAFSAYSIGLILDPRKVFLYCIRAACSYKRRDWSGAIDDCNHALGLYRNFQKALILRAASYGKLGRWDEAAGDFNVLRKVFGCEKVSKVRLGSVKLVFGDKLFPTRPSLRKELAKLIEDCNKKIPRASRLHFLTRLENCRKRMYLRQIALGLCFICNGDEARLKLIEKQIEKVKVYLEEAKAKNATRDHHGLFLEVYANDMKNVYNSQDNYAREHGLGMVFRALTEAVMKKYDI